MARPTTGATTGRGAHPGADRAYREAYDAAYVDGLKAEQSRCEAIICSPEAKGREVLALHVAVNTTMGSDAAIAMLALSAKAAPPPEIHDPVGFARAVGLHGFGAK